MTATRFLVTDLARELRWQYRRQSVKAFTDIIAELENLKAEKYTLTHFPAFKG